MKKFLTLSALAMVAAAPVAMAKDQGGPPGGPGGPGHHRNPDRMIEMIFGKHDLDKDGTISKEEFMKEAEERFSKMDLNSDGKVTKEEAKKHAEKMMERFKERRGEGGHPPPPPPEE